MNNSVQFHYKCRWCRKIYCNEYQTLDNMAITCLMNTVTAQALTSYHHCRPNATDSQSCGLADLIGTRLFDRAAASPVSAMAAAAGDAVE